MLLLSLYCKNAVKCAFLFSVRIHLEQHSGSLECVTVLFVYLNACDNIRGSILLHFGVLPLSSHRSRIWPDVVQILKMYHVCFVFFLDSEYEQTIAFSSDRVVSVLLTSWQEFLHNF